LVETAGASYIAKERGNHASVSPTGCLTAKNANGFYFSAVETVVKVALSCVPSVATTVIIAIEIPAAMRPYSMAVAPECFS
jgi:hypothetical protein